MSKNLKKSWRFVRNLRATKASDLGGMPWDVKKKHPNHKTKAQHRLWALNKKTDHVFFTAFEGVNVAQRIDRENPPLKMLGWVADYDADIDLDDMVKKINKLPVDLRPTHISSTFSGGARAVWEFEQPVWVDCPEVTAKFIQKFSGAVAAARLAAGFDAASLTPSMVWEVGFNWRKIKESMEVPPQVTEALFTESVIQTKQVKAKYTDVPLNEVQDEVEKQYPGRLDGFELELGARIPLFWIPPCGDGKENDTSAIVAEWGIHSFSSRCEKGQMFWDELLGDDFVRQFKDKVMATAIDGIYYDGTGYWRKNRKGLWVGCSREDILLVLKVERGVKGSKDAKATSSELEDALYRIQEMHRVDATGPFSYTDESFVKFNGETYLNINHRRPVQPAENGDPENFPWLHNFVTNFLHQHADDDLHPYLTLCAELQRVVKSYLSNRPTSGHGNILVGDTGKGKSFFTTYVLREMLGSATDAGSFLVSGKDFNKSLTESAIWFIDDNKSTVSVTQHKQFSENLKKHIATPEVQHQPKFKDSRPLPWFGRIFITCNEDPDSITIVPDMDINIRDKVNLFRVNPEFQAIFADVTDMQDMIRRELPFFVRWLLDMEFPEGILDSGSNRYGINTYHHPDIIDSARESSSQFRLSEILDLWMEGQADSGDAFWEGSSTGLLQALSDNDAGGMGFLMKSYTPVSFGRQLQGLAKLNECPYLTSSTQDKKLVWKLEFPEAPVRKRSRPED